MIPLLQVELIIPIQIYIVMFCEIFFNVKDNLLGMYDYEEIHADIDCVFIIVERQYTNQCTTYSHGQVIYIVSYTKAIQT